MLIIDPKSGSGIFTPYNHPALGHGLFDFVKRLFHKGIQSGFAKSAAEHATKAINSSIGQKAIAGAKQAAKSKLGQELQKTVVSEVSKTALETAENAFKKIGVEPPKTLLTGLARKTEDAAHEAFKKLGLTPPVKKLAPVKKSAPKRKRRTKKGPKAKVRKGGFLTQSDLPEGPFWPKGYDPYNPTAYRPYGHGIIIE